MDNKTFSGRNQSVGCALAWVALACDSETAYSFYPVGQFHRICAGQLWCQTDSSLTNLSLSVSSVRYCTSSIIGFRVYGNTPATLFTHYPIVWTVKRSAVGTRALAAWVTTARGSDSEYPFYPAGQFHRIFAGH